LYLASIKRKGRSEHPAKGAQIIGEDRGKGPRKRERINYAKTLYIIVSKKYSKTCSPRKAKIGLKSKTPPIGGISLRNILR